MNDCVNNSTTVIVITVENYWQWMTCQQFNDSHCYYSRKLRTMNDCVNNSTTAIVITVENYWQRITVSTIQRQPLLLQYKITDNEWLCQKCNDSHCYYSRKLLTTNDRANNSTTVIFITVENYWQWITVSTVQRQPLFFYSRKLLTMNNCVNNSTTAIVITVEHHWQWITVSTIQRQPLLLQ
jgi:hypothetical protein